MGLGERFTMVLEAWIYFHFWRSYEPQTKALHLDYLTDFHEVTGLPETLNSVTYRWVS